MLVFSTYVAPIPHWPLPAARDLTCDRLSTYEESVLKLSKVSFRGKCARMGQPLKLPSPNPLKLPSPNPLKLPSPNPLKLPSPTKLARLGWVIFPQLGRRAALPARCSILYLFSGCRSPLLSFSPLTLTPSLCTVCDGERGGSQSYKELPQSPFPGHFSMTSFCIAFCESYLSMASSLHHKLT